MVKKTKKTKSAPKRVGPLTTTKKAKSASPAKSKPKRLAASKGLPTDSTGLKNSNAPDFSLLSEAGKLRLSDFLGKKNVVLFFYPRDNTSGCTREACDFAEHKARFDSTDTVVLGISPDSVDSHIRFREKFNLNFTLLSDPNSTIAKTWGAWGHKSLYGKKYQGIIRSTFLIDKDGHVAKTWHKVRVNGHCSDVLREVLNLNAN